VPDERFSVRRVLFEAPARTTRSPCSTGLVAGDTGEEVGADDVIEPLRYAGVGFCTARASETTIQIMNVMEAPLIVTLPDQWCVQDILRRKVGK